MAHRVRQRRSSTPLWQHGYDRGWYFSGRRKLLRLHWWIVMGGLTLAALHWLGRELLLLILPLFA